MAHIVAAPRQPLHHSMERPSRPGQNSGCMLPRALGQRVGQLPEALRAHARGKVIDLVFRTRLLVQRSRSHRPRSPPARCRRGRRAETAAPAGPPERRTRAPCRTAWFPGGGCRPARCWDERPCAARRAAVRAPCVRRISWCARRDRSRSGSQSMARSSATTSLLRWPATATVLTSLKRRNPWLSWARRAS